jgi:hypothetical protein
MTMPKHSDMNAHYLMLKMLMDQPDNTDLLHKLACDGLALDSESMI